MPVARNPQPAGEAGFPRHLDHGLLAVAAALVLCGLVMVASASMHAATQRFGDPLGYFWRQLLFTAVSVALAWPLLYLPASRWRWASVPLLFIALVLLLAVLIPGIGKEVNGSQRWIALGPANLQPSEFAKLALIAYLAGYLVRRADEVKAQARGALKVISVLMFITFLLMLEPDYGSAVVIMMLIMGLLFLAGVPLAQFIPWLAGMAIAFGVLVLLAPYRLQRLYAFLNPWEHAYTSGFQLTQALIAMGRGGWWGEGLGNSVQKLTYLPEAHTDFIFAILAEETGLAGVLLILALYGALVQRGLAVAWRAAELGQGYSAYLAYGITLTLGLQTAVNLAVNTGLLPTKGLPLPLFSYGGSSMLASILMVAVLLRISHENQQEK